MSQKSLELRSQKVGSIGFFRKQDFCFCLSYPSRYASWRQLINKNSKIISPVTDICTSLIKRRIFFTTLYPQTNTTKVWRDGEGGELTGVSCTQDLANISCWGLVLGLYLDCSVKYKRSIRGPHDRLDERNME